MSDRKEHDKLERVRGWLDTYTITDESTREDLIRELNRIRAAAAR